MYSVSIAGAAWFYFQSGWSYSIKNPTNTCNFTIFILNYLQFRTLSSKNYCKQSAWFSLTSHQALDLPQKVQPERNNIAFVLCFSNANISGYFRNQEFFLL